MSSKTEAQPGEHRRGRTPRTKKPTKTLYTDYRPAADAKAEIKGVIENGLDCVEVLGSVLDQLIRVLLWYDSERGYYNLVLYSTEVPYTDRKHVSFKHGDLEVVLAQLSFALTTGQCVIQEGEPVVPSEADFNW